MKIAYCLNSIRGGGGIERVTIKKANSLSEIEGNQVFVLVTDHKRGQTIDALNEKVTLIDLDVNYYDDDWQKGWKSRVSQFRKKKEHKNKLRETLNRITPDVLIAVGQSEKFFLTKGFLKNSSTVYIRELHFATNYRILLAKSLKERLIGRIQNFFDFQLMCRLYDAVVCLTPEDLQANWQGRANAYFIPNPLTIDFPIEVKSNDDKKIISLGRLTPQKNYSSLIRSFSKVAHDFPEWTVEIYGSGSQHHYLEGVIDHLELTERVKLMGYADAACSKLNSAQFFVLTSIMEGFALVLLEAMAHGLPVISYDCPFGPSFIIQPENGLLIPINDELKLSQAMEYLMREHEVRKEMGHHARLRAQEFLPEIIAEQWMTLFNNLIKQKG